MLNIPQQYQVNQPIALKTIFSGEMKPAEKKRLKNSLKSVLLTHQISGETIPSWVDENHRCEVIMFLDVHLETLRPAESISALLQRLIKPPCVIRFYDTHQELFSFAHKRISHKDAGEIVLEQSVITPPQPILSSHARETLLAKALDFKLMQNTANKKDLYIEAMTKAFIACYPAIFSRVTEFLDSSIWYNSGEVLELLGSLKKLQELKQQKVKALQIKDKVAVNGKIKQIIEGIKIKLGA